MLCEGHQGLGVVDTVESVGSSCGIQGEAGPLFTSFLTLRLNGNIYTFAYDTSVANYRGKTDSEIENKCRGDLKLMTGLLKEHRICPNFNKTNVMKYQYRTLRDTNINIY